MMETIEMLGIEKDSTNKPNLEQITEAIITLTRAHTTGVLADFLSEGHFGDGLAFFVDASSPIMVDKIGEIVDVPRDSGALLSAMALRPEGKIVFSEVLAMFAPDVVMNALGYTMVTAQCKWNHKH